MLITQAQKDRVDFKYWDMIQIVREAENELLSAKRFGGPEQIQEAEEELNSWKSRLIAAYGEAAWNKV